MEWNMDQRGVSLTVLVALIVGLSVVGAVGLIIALGSFNSQSNPGQGGTPLSSAGDLVGTWGTSFSTKYYYATDANNPGTLEDIASEDRQVTWTITQGGANTVNIVQDYTASNVQQIGAGGLYTPDFSGRADYTGAISSSSLTVKSGNTNVGYFTFTSNNITGTWNDDSLSAIYLENVHTAINGLILTKQ